MRKCQQAAMIKNASRREGLATSKTAGRRQEAKMFAQEVG
jgi:hypothetical protein